MIEAYDFHLDVESEVNEGTTFVLKFKQIDSPA
jgi:hypothetical protein